MFGTPADSPIPTPSADSFKLAMEACRRAGDTTEVLSVLARMKLDGVTPDLVSAAEYLARSFFVRCTRLRTTASWVVRTGEAWI